MSSTPDGSGDPGDENELAVLRGLAAATVAALAAAAGGPAAALAAAGLTPVLERLVLEGKQRYDRNAARVASYAAEQLGTSEQAFGEQASRSTERLHLTISSLRAGHQTLWDDKVTALARALADGLADDARVDHQLLVVSALADLEKPHLQVLDVLADGAGYEGAAVFSAVFHRQALVDRLPHLEDLLPVLINTLVRQGLATEDQDWFAALRPPDAPVPRLQGTVSPPREVSITAFGMECLDYLRHGMQGQN
jgi:hypothetical protein